MYANSGRSLVPLFFLTICIKISLKKKGENCVEQEPGLL